ncbi:hypothetical protein DB32_005228 [Sandaracinus amylolyticus]|uniref:Uncharacterized protein n=1 Tax=Sandaracinus amylolyticus TaxID=927083 RepID=A0A0F6SG50_9BACT|nr:hypothetical protein DB32_005228 [Sandaracinus amylolyticus]
MVITKTRRSASALPFSTPRPYSTGPCETRSTPGAHRTASSPS